ncbi:PhoB family transcriptional regulator [Opitutaceae bacterium TAV5]|nr:PhoB family transcriptional regulator [Opitutaceae bacterium TAV5]
MRILVAEDEKPIARFVASSLRESGFSVDTLHRGDEVLPVLETTPYDVLVLDIMLPGRDGLSILREMRQRGMTLPVLLLTARGSTEERVEGLNLGADDYLVKPFAVDELVARLHALLRRSNDSSRLTVHRVANLTLDFVKRIARRGDRRIELSTREFALLECLMRSPGRVVTRARICEYVWDYQFDPGTNIVDVYVQRLRRKIDDGEDVKLIHTRRGFGYYVGEEESS